MKTTLISILLLAALTVGILGWRGRTSSDRPIQIWNDMTDQPKYLPQKASGFFADGRVDRTPPAGAIAWGRSAAEADAAFVVNDKDCFALSGFPPEVKIDRNLVMRGKMLFENNCRICHGSTGAGNGITTQYGLNQPPSYFIDRLKSAPNGYIYLVITEGKGQMGPYGPNVKPADRWAIVSYVRVLQRAASGTISDVPEERRAEMDK
ncbi:cytochrome c [soil metagenome]